MNKILNENELRLGNLFIEEKSSKIISVIGLEKNRIVFDGNFKNDWQAKPINITTEWLFNFGFAQLTNVNEGFKQNVFTIKKNNNYLAVNFDYVLKVEAFNYLDINYVHQLQNLYFCLTGIELTIKIKRDENNNY